MFIWNFICKSKGGIQFLYFINHIFYWWFVVIFIICRTTNLWFIMFSICIIMYITDNFNTPVWWKQAFDNKHFHNQAGFWLFYSWYFIIHTNDCTQHCFAHTLKSCVCFVLSIFSAISVSPKMWATHAYKFVLFKFKKHKYFVQNSVSHYNFHVNLGPSHV